MLSIMYVVDIGRYEQHDVLLDMSFYYQLLYLVRVTYDPVCWCTVRAIRTVIDQVRTGGIYVSVFKQSCDHALQSGSLSLVDHRYNLKLWRIVYIELYVAMCCLQYIVHPSYLYCVRHRSAPTVLTSFQEFYYVLFFATLQADNFVQSWGVLLATCNHKLLPSVNGSLLSWHMRPKAADSCGQIVPLWYLNCHMETFQKDSMGILIMMWVEPNSQTLYSLHSSWDGMCVHTMGTVHMLVTPVHDHLSS